jgi:hypothetical protein
MKSGHVAVSKLLEEVALVKSKSSEILKLKFVQIFA